MLFKRKDKDKEPFVYRVFGRTLGAVVLFFVEVVQIIVIAAAIIIPIRVFLIKPFVVKGASMEPNFYNDEYLIIDEISYRFNDVKRGEIVVFIPPNNRSQFYIKRVVGLPGEEVEIVDGSIMIYNDEFPEGLVLEESYVDEYTHGRTRVLLGADEVYLVGDNRDHSLDSRSFGPVHINNIVGRAWLRGLPIDKIGTIIVPEYNL